MTTYRCFQSKLVYLLWRENDGLNPASSVLIVFEMAIYYTLLHFFGIVVRPFLIIINNNFFFVSANTSGSGIEFFFRCYLSLSHRRPVRLYPPILPNPAPRNPHLNPTNPSCSKANPYHTQPSSSKPPSPPNHLISFQTHLSSHNVPHHVIPSIISSQNYLSCSHPLLLPISTHTPELLKKKESSKKNAARTRNPSLDLVSIPNPHRLRSRC